MKEVRKFIIVNIILMLFKVLASYVCKSNVLLMLSLYDLILIINSILVYKKKDNKKYKCFISSILGIIYLMLAIGIIFVTINTKYVISSLWILLFIFIFIMMRYMVSCFATNKAYAKRSGLLTYGNMVSNTDFYMYGLVILSLVLGKCNKWFDVLRYSDKALTVCVSLFVFYKAIKLIACSISYLEKGTKEISDEFTKEISDRSEVKKINSIDIGSYGGVRCLNLNVSLNNNINMIDLNSFMITLQDYLLKISDICVVTISESKISNAFEKVKKNARNSGSGNSKTNTKKKNTKKKNKKR